MHKYSKPIKAGRPAGGTDESRLIMIAPPYLANAEALHRLFGDISAADADEQCYRSPALGCLINDLSALDHRSLNLALLSSRSDVLLLVVDAAFGLEKRHFWIMALACLASIPNIVVAIDNMAHVDWSRQRFQEMTEGVADHAASLGCGKLEVVPIDFASDRNIRESTSKAAWYEGPPLLARLSQLEIPPKKIQPDKTGQTSDQFAVHLCWRSDAPLLPGRHYLLKHGREQAEAHVSSLKHRLNSETIEHQAAKKLLSGDIGYCNISLDNAISFDPFEVDRDTGSFELYDKTTGEPAAFGLIKHELRRATNIKWQALLVDKAARALGKNQTPCVLWFTGLSGSGKSTIASLVEKGLHARGKHTYVLDGDNVRHGLCRDLGFTDADRVENLRRISETAKLFVDAGLIVLVSFISPFSSERKAARKMFAEGEFLEIFVDTPLEVCEARDVKGLYKKARSGLLKNFTGIDSPYEPPEEAEIILPGARANADQLADMVLAQIEERGLIPKSG